MLLRLEGAVANASIRLDPRDAYVVPEWGDVIVIADRTPVDGSQGASRSADRSKSLVQAQGFGGKTAR
jgi:hypothetical protein